MESPQATVTVELTLRVGSEPIAGALRGADGEARPFVGWVALVRSLENAMNAGDSEAMLQLGWSGGGPTAGTNLTPQNSTNFDVRALKNTLDNLSPERTETEGIEQEGEPGIGHAGDMSQGLLRSVFAAPGESFSLKPNGLGVSKEEMFGLENWSIHKFGCGEPLG